MKSKKIVYGFALLSFSAALTFTACKKKDTKTDETTTTTSTETPDGQSGTDNRDVTNENDQSNSEANDALSHLSVTGGRVVSSQSILGGICGYDIDSASMKNDTLILKYNGVTCLNRTRTGKIILSWAHGTKWTNLGATIKIDYVNYKITRASDKRSIMFNGSQNLKNVSGGNFVTLVLTPNYNLVNTVTGTNLNVTFEDGKTAVYNINRKLTYTFPNGILTAKAEGIGTSGTSANLENYGTARNGDIFTSQVTTPIVWNVTCGGAVLQGVVSLTDVTKNVNLKFTYGVDANGNAQTVSANNCPYGWKLEWTANGSTSSKVFGYN